MRIHELLDMPLLGKMLADGYVGMQTHPTEQLVIYNYTHAAQYDRVWNAVTRQCRGLIVDQHTGEIVARPFPKFFNYGEHEDRVTRDPDTNRKVYPESDFHWKLDLDAPVRVTDKADGSLGILYPVRKGYDGCVCAGPDTCAGPPCSSAGYGWAIATRGSFTSEQAIRATAMWNERYAGKWEPGPGTTTLFEIIYRENRIVLDYDYEDLVHLASLSNETGLSTETAQSGPVGWPGRRVERMPAHTLREALALEPRPNAEGVVVTYAETGLMLKIKQEDYVALHRIVTGLNERTVWERVGAGESVRDICEALPDEFARWVEDVHLGLQFEADHVWYAARDAFSEIENIKLGGIPYTRKEFADASAEYPDVRSYLFMMLDGKDIRPAIWRSIKPLGGAGVGRKLLAVTEDTA